MGMRSHAAAAPAAALALGLFLTPPVSIAIGIGNLGLMSPAMGQPGTLTKKQSDALAAYNKAASDF